MQPQQPSKHCTSWTSYHDIVDLHTAVKRIRVLIGAQRYPQRLCSRAARKPCRDHHGLQGPGREARRDASRQVDLREQRRAVCHHQRHRSAVRPRSISGVEGDRRPRSQNDVLRYRRAVALQGQVVRPGGSVAVAPVRGAAGHYERAKAPSHRGAASSPLPAGGSHVAEGVRTLNVRLEIAVHQQPCKSKSDMNR